MFFKKKKRNDNLFECVYAGPEKMEKFPITNGIENQEDDENEFLDVYAGPEMWDEPRISEIYAAPEMMDEMINNLEDEEEYPKNYSKKEKQSISKLKDEDKIV